ncbi:MAG: hypothetical protein HY980_01040 [Candidatus Magasanikbacteria bacterium]|nr:hypothetical protein [Candidatus Magasanikbacteria bacterium]
MKKNQLFLLFALFLALTGFMVPAGKTVAANNPYITINKNQMQTNVRKVTLQLSGPAKTVQMKVSNSVDLAGAAWEPYKTTKTWFLEYGKGTHTVYVRFKDKKGVVSELYKDTINLVLPDKMTVDFVINKDSKGKDAKETDSRFVVLSITYSVGVESIVLSNSKDLSLLEWEDVGGEMSWTLSPDSGEKTVYAEFKDANGVTKVISKKITYNQPKYYIPEGSLLKGQASTVYYLGYDGKIHPFPNSAVYHSWYSNFDDVQAISNVKLGQYPIGQPVCVREGTWLVKFRVQPTVYAAEPGCHLHLIRSETEAVMIYGKDWAKRVVELDSILEGYYEIEYPEYDDSKVDKDKDGVDKDLEKEYGSSDLARDSDEDGLTDFEEIYFWYTDPAQADTDDDGFKDGAETVVFYSPVGGGQIDAAPTGAYVYPLGSLIFSGGKYYYRSYNGKFYYVSKNAKDGVFTTNRFESKFAIKSPFAISFSAGKNKLGKSDGKIIKPQLRTAKGAMVDF